MGVFPPKENALRGIFGNAEKIVVGVVHSKPLPGSPHYRGESMEKVYRYAVEEGLRYAEGGVDGLIVENHWDIPFAKPDDIGFETAAAMATMVDRVSREVGIPLGVNVLANGVECALAVAMSTDAVFVRANQWVNAYVANEGFVEGAASKATRYRAMIHAGDVKVFADVHVKHGSHAIVADRSLEEQTRDAEFFDADVLIATGQRTGGEPDLRQLEVVKEVADLPVLVGSGVTEGNAERILSIADGAIVASSLKEDGNWWSPVSIDRVRRLIEVVRGV
jgi:membrane complex biogenesis BtpA family protein